MISQIRIQNLGKLADATVRIGGLTVLAGVNNTGKTFFSKSLYSVVEAMNTDYIMAGFNERADAMRQTAQYLANNGMASASGELIEAVDRMELVAKNTSAESGDLVGDPGQKYLALKDAGKKVLETFERLDPELQNWEAGNTRRVISGSILGNNAIALSKLGQMTAGEIAASGFRSQVVRNLVSNFQARGANSLGEGGAINIHIDGEHILGLGGFDGHYVNESAVLSALSRVRPPNSFFLDSPALWRLKELLQGVLLESRNGRVRTDVPDYFRALFAALLKKYSGDMPFPEIFRRLTEDVIRGKIVQDDLGRLFYAESGKGRVYPLWQTATGVVNIGVLALLIEKKLVDEGTFLFIDEPESNLHPEWQVEMTEALWELARGGVNVVIATHGVDILKRLDIYAKEEKEEAEKILAVNHFQRDGTVQSGGVEMIRGVKRDLSAPFFKLYKRGL